MRLVKRYSVKNPCYINNVIKLDSRYTNFQKNGASGLMLHSVGCPQPDAEVFANLWNSSSADVAVHGVLQPDGTVYHCLPWNYRGWHGGSGKNGSVNDTLIGIEMTEPDCIKYTRGASFTCSDIPKARKHVEANYKVAVELFAYLCKEFGFDPMTDIISHKEGGKKDIASDHADPEHLWTGLGLPYTMDTFRKAVRDALSADTAPTESEVYRVRKAWNDAKTQLGAFRDLDNAKDMADKNPGYKVYNSAGLVVYPVEEKTELKSFKVRVTISDLNIREGAGYKKYKSVGFCPPGAYTIVETKVADGFTWGRLKSGIGWIALEYTERL